MPFTLFYRGPLKSNGSPADKQVIRRLIHPQLALLWAQEPLLQFAGEKEGYLQEYEPRSKISLIYPVGDFKCACLISERLHLRAELSITFLRPGAPGGLIQTGGDIDNRLKTLFDGLRRPLVINELPPNDKPAANETPFHCLLSDDALISSVDVRTDQLLYPASKDEVVLLIKVTIVRSQVTWGNISYPA